MVAECQPSGHSQSVKFQRCSAISNKREYFHKPPKILYTLCCMTKIKSYLMDRSVLSERSNWFTAFNIFTSSSPSAMWWQWLRDGTGISSRKFSSVFALYIYCLTVSHAYSVILTMCTQMSSIFLYVCGLRATLIRFLYVFVILSSHPYS